MARGNLKSSGDAFYSWSRVSTEDVGGGGRWVRTSQLNGTSGNVVLEFQRFQESVEVPCVDLCVILADIRVQSRV